MGRDVHRSTKRGIVYVPTGSPKYNFYGANRKGANLFGDCLLALDARTGKRLWHFQMVHHDIWDYDNATAPKLLTVRHGGKTLDVVAQAGKTGFLYVFDRVTGEPLWPIEERPVPKSDMPGEETWPTQPFPTAPPPFARQSVHREGSQPVHRRSRRSAPCSSTTFAARGTKGCSRRRACATRSQMPGNNGGSNFSGAAIDPERGTMFVVSKDFPAHAEARTAEALIVGGLGCVDGACRPGLHPLHQRFRLHGHQQRTLGDRAAVDDDDRVRLECGHDPLADPIGGGSGARGKRLHAIRAAISRR